MCRDQFQALYLHTEMCDQASLIGYLRTQHTVSCQANNHHKLTAAYVSQKLPLDRISPNASWEVTPLCQSLSYVTQATGSGFHLEETE